MIIKICGIQKEETLLCCEKNKVDFFGMIFYSKSPRNISIENAYRLQKGSEKLNINGVGVFVNKNIDELEQIINNLRLKFVQLHGSEDEKYNGATGILTINEQGQIERTMSFATIRNGLIEPLIIE